MKRNVFVFVLAISLVFAFLNSTVYAANFDFQVSPSIISACPCSSITPQNVQISIKNLYQYPDTYSFVIDAPAGITPQVQQNLVVNQGDTRNLDLFLINIGCSVLPGDYNVVIKAKSGTTGETQTKTLSLSVLNCYEVQLNIESKYRDMCTEENTSSVFYLVLQNRGKYSDTYDLSASVPWASFSDNPVTIDAGKSKTVALALTPPSGTKGLQLINVYVKSQKFYSNDMDTIQLNIQDCYSMTADLQPSEVSICLGEVVNQKVTIANTGIKADNYSVIVPNWVTADKPVVSIDAKKSADVSLTLKPAQKGKTFFNVTVVSAKDPVLRAVLSASVDAQECRGVAVIATPASSYVCQGVESEFTVTVKNLGTIQDTFNVTATSGVLDFNKVVLDPKETKEFKLKILNITSPGNYSVKVKAQSDGISDDDSVIVVVDNCYSASMDISPQNISVCFGTPVSYTVAVKNTGKLSDNYTLRADSPVTNLTKQFTLGPNQVRMEYFTIQVPSEPQANDYLIKVTLQSEHTSAGSQSLLSVKPKTSCYSVQIIPKDEAKLVQICNATTLPVAIKNTGEKKDKYNLSIDGPQWAYISPNVVELSGGQQQEVYLYFSPCFGVEKKVYEMTIKASSPSAQVVKNIAVGVVENITGGGGITPPPVGNETNMIGGNITGGLILGLDTNQWKLLAIVIITLIIIIILAIRFIMLAK
ncbi:MAG: hypothetical protein NTY20_04535 [Candidatus Aenigmarchaeota archaeon]|nr:hypothetical protein [Candidatus Aenigmarchaeota archaeon]